MAGVTPSSAVGAEALAVRAAYEAAMRNELPYFAPVTMFPGFARATAATIGDLRAAGIAAEKLEALDESGPDHAALLERFQDQMEEVSVADRTNIFQAAVEEVRAGADLTKHPLLLDVPIHSAIERAFIVELAAAAKEVLFTCPAGDLRTLDNLEMVPGAQSLDTTVHPNKISSDALDQLFREARTHSAWLPKKVQVETLREAYELARMGPDLIVARCPALTGPRSTPNSSPMASGRSTSCAILATAIAASFFLAIHGWSLTKHAGCCKRRLEERPVDVESVTVVIQSCLRERPVAPWWRAVNPTLSQLQIWSCGRQGELNRSDAPLTTVHAQGQR